MNYVKLAAEIGNACHILIEERARKNRTELITVLTWPATDSGKPYPWGNTKNYAGTKGRR